ncbi:DUF2726 domain-containing protein [Microvirga tunisiensis]|nr:DUF2726 domain-containing protein [Microvirga tunisiensis]
MAVLLALFGLVALLRKDRYRPRPLLTDNEREFHRRLLSALPGYEIAPQVSMLALLEPDLKTRNKRYWRTFNAIGNARVDWVILKDQKPIAVVELDDSTHDPTRDRKRDAILNSCGYRVIRFESRNRPSIGQIRETVAQL